MEAEGNAVTGLPTHIASEIRGSSVAAGGESGRVVDVEAITHEGTGVRPRLVSREVESTLRDSAEDSVLVVESVARSKGPATLSHSVWTQVESRPVKGSAGGGFVIDVEAITGTETRILPEPVPRKIIITLRNSSGYRMLFVKVMFQAK